MIRRICILAWLVLLAYLPVFYFWGDKPMIANIANGLNAVGENLIAVWAVYWTVPIALSSYLIYLWRKRPTKDKPANSIRSEPVPLAIEAEVLVLPQFLDALAPVFSSGKEGDCQVFLRLRLTPSVTQVSVKHPILNIWQRKVIPHLFTSLQITTAVEETIGFIIPRAVTNDTKDAYVSLIANGNIVESPKIEFKFSNYRKL